jgi:hypothetical protein
MSQRTKKVGTNKAPLSEAVWTETAIPTEPVAAQSTESSTSSTLELLPTATALLAQDGEPSPVQTAPRPTLTTKRGAWEAALRVLGASGQAMRCPELIAAMATKGYWSSPKGRTPASTLYASFLREIQTKGETARVVTTTRGKFALRERL